MQQNQQQFGKYCLKEQIGAGQFSKVYRCINQDSNEEFAIKCMPKQHFWDQPQLFKLLETELKLLTTIKHENIIKLIDNFENSNYFCLVYEFCNDGTLEQFIQKRKFITKEELISYTFQLLSALKCLHKQSLLHRDIKPANILLSQNKQILKLADFGFCKQTQLTQTFLGTPGYIAPEILFGMAYNQKADVFSLGICLWKLFSKCSWDLSLTALKKILEKMVVQNPHQRPNIFQICQVFTNYYGSSNKCQRNLNQDYQCNQTEKNKENMFNQNTQLQPSNHLKNPKNNNYQQFGFYENKLSRKDYLRKYYKANPYLN